MATAARFSAGGGSLSGSRVKPAQRYAIFRDGFVKFVLISKRNSQEVMRRGVFGVKVQSVLRLGYDLGQFGRATLLVRHPAALPLKRHIYLTTLVKVLSRGGGASSIFGIVWQSLRRRLVGQGFSGLVLR